MLLFWTLTTRRIVAALSAGLLVIMLAACGGSGSTTTSSPSHVAPVPAVTLQTYRGTGFSISYPVSWHKNASGDQVTFADPVGRNVLAIFADPNGMEKQSETVLANQMMAKFKGTLLANAQNVTVPSTFMVGKYVWLQRSATGMLAITDPGVQGNLFLLVINYPPQTAHTMAYEIEYYGPSSTFGQANVTFTRMLQSFRFQ